MATCGADEICGGLSNLLMSEEAAGDIEAATQSTGNATMQTTQNQSVSTRNAKEEASETEIDPESDATNDEIRATVFMISGCQDSQTSADVSNVANFSLPDPNGKAGGACTSALLNVLYADHQAITDLTFAQVIKRMRTMLVRQRFSQVPQLSSSHNLNMQQDFYLVPPDCQGTKRAVLIGINYFGKNGELSGCINDCMNMKDYIMDVWGFKEENITVLMDDGSHTEPTRSNILSAYKNVANQSRSGDAVFCHYSGHGGRVRDDDWDEEADGYDETLIPVDYESSGQIRDDDLYKSLVLAMAEGVHLVALMDCCHSGSVLDLPYKYKGGISGGMTYAPNGASSSLATMMGGEYSIATMCICFCCILIAAVIALPIIFLTN